MTRAEDETATDMAARLLGWAVGLLPAGRSEWGQAMRAELARIETPSARWRFAMGCLRVALAQPRPIGVIACPLLGMGLVAATAVRAAAITYAPLRAGLIALAAIPVTLMWPARRPGWFGPVHRSRTPRLVRAGGYVLVGGAALLVVNGFCSAAGDPGEKAQLGVPILAFVLVVYLVAFLIGQLATRRQASLPWPSARGAASGVPWCFSSRCWSGLHYRRPTDGRSPPWRPPRAPLCSPAGDGRAEVYRARSPCSALSW